MIVMDASAVVEILTNGPLAEPLRDDLASRDATLIAPHLLDVEVANVLRRLAIGKRIDAHRAEEFLASLAALPVERVPHTPLLGRIWELRHNFSPYDAAYIALAEATAATLYTCDTKLCRGHHARVELFALWYPPGVSSQS